MIDTELIALYKSEATLERQILAYKGIISELENKPFMGNHTDCLRDIKKELIKCTKLYDKSLSEDKKNSMMKYFSRRTKERI